MTTVGAAEVGVPVQMAIERGLVLTGRGVCRDVDSRRNRIRQNSLGNPLAMLIFPKLVMIGLQVAEQRRYLRSEISGEGDPK